MAQNDKMTIEKMQKQFDEIQKELFPAPVKKNNFKKIITFAIPTLLILLILFFVFYFF